MPGQVINVLYIDDDEILGRLVQRILARRGYACIHAPGADEGLALVEAGGVDVVILDHDLGIGSGIDVLRALNARAAPPPVVYVTASTELSIAVEALKAGAVDYVVKTIGDDFEVLLVAALEQSVEKARLTRAKERAERELRESRDRAVVLLAEVNHRVANSLALVSSLVRMQAASVADPATQAALSETQARIAAIANLHRSLYTSEDVRVVDLSAYLGAVVAELEQSVSAAGHTPSIRLTASPVTVATDRAVAIGMIATELVTNAIKYAYPDGGGEIRVQLALEDGGDLVLAVADDGVGWSGEGPSTGTGLGGRIVRAMAKSLASRVEYAPADRGTTALLRIPPPAAT